MKNSLIDKVIIITGASSGIGEKMAKILANEGAKVVLAARREEKLREIVENIKSFGGCATYKVVDVTKNLDLNELMRFTFKEFGRIDVLINNAGIMLLSPISQLKVEEWERMIDVNLKGSLYAIAAALPYLKKSTQGQIININSAAGHNVSENAAVYSATKFGIQAFSKGFVQEETVRMTNISPGPVKTDLASHISDSKIKKSISDFIKENALSSEDVVNAVLYVLTQPSHVLIKEVQVSSIKRFKID